MTIITSYPCLRKLSQINWLRIVPTIIKLCFKKGLNLRLNRSTTCLNESSKPYETDFRRISSKNSFVYLLFKQEILFYNATLHEYKHHVRQILELLAVNGLYLNSDKCKFH